jgi:L-seryl-tRNA(Ser) seleniumtransferase
MDRLPDTSGVPNEIVIARSHRSGYDHALRAAGARLVEVGLPDPAAWEIEVAITANTVAVAYAAGFSMLSLCMVCDVAHDKGLPVIVDAAAELPPPVNLRAFIAAGADLVVFSGGKAIGGPQASGILCGRKDLIASAALQHWDMDVHEELFDPPDCLVDVRTIGGVPHHGIGRGFKVGREEIVGLVTALEMYTASDHTARRMEWDGLIQRIREGLGTLAEEGGQSVAQGASPVDISVIDEPGGVPRIALVWTRPRVAFEVARALKAGEPSIHLRETDAPAGRLDINPLCLTPLEADEVVRRLREVVRDRTWPTTG